MSSRLCKPALAVAAALLGAGPLLAAAAYAEPSDGATITFSGDPGTPGACSSEPHSTSDEIYAGSVVTFENQTGADGTLYFSGQSRPLAAGQQFQRRFGVGELTTKLDLQCSPLGGSFGSVTVEIVERPDQDAAPPAAGPPMEPPGAGHPADPVRNEPGVVADPDRTTGALDPVTTDAVLDTVGDPAAVPAGNNVAAGRGRPAAPMPSGVSGLLALVAAVCVAGVSSAAIRAILSQRASRAAAA